MHVTLFLQEKADKVDKDTSRTATKERDEEENGKEESGNRERVKSQHDITV
jgi:hypothetical protein